MKILFITRKYPPSTGGMEKFSKDFYTVFQNNCTLLALCRPQVHLLWWLPYVFVQGARLARSHDVVHIGDGVLAWVGVLIHWLTKKPISITVHGLDVTYTKFGYQKIIWSALKQYQAIVCVSSATAEIVRQHGLDATVIPNGIIIEHQGVLPIKKEQSDTVTLLTVGRLVPRKGVAWFVENVLSQLPREYVYTIIGAGPEYEQIQDIIVQQQLNERVKLLGRVSDTTIHDWYRQADLFIMPNVQVDNDMEGFGIVAIEAAAAGLPTVAANLDGLRDAVIDGETGFLVESGHPEAWKTAIETLMTPSSVPRSGTPTGKQINPESIQQAVKEKYSWDKVKEQYLQVFKKLV